MCIFKNFSMLGLSFLFLLIQFIFFNIWNINKLKTMLKGMFRHVPQSHISFIHFPHLLYISNLIVFWNIFPVFLFVKRSICTHVFSFSLFSYIQNNTLYMVFGSVISLLSNNSRTHSISVHGVLPHFFLQLHCVYHSLFS